MMESLFRSNFWKGYCNDLSLKLVVKLQKFLSAGNWQRCSRVHRRF